MSLFFYLFTLAINLWHRKFVTADASLQCLTTIYKRQGQDFDTKFVFERVGSEEVDRRISWETWQSVVLISCSKSCGTHAQWTGDQAWQTAQCPHWRQELIRRWDSERELLYDDNIHVEASAYAHW